MNGHCLKHNYEQTIIGILLCDFKYSHCNCFSKYPKIIEGRNLLLLEAPRVKMI